MKDSNAAIIWFRNDLRLADNPALQAAVSHGGPVVPVFIWAPGEEGNWPPGSASRWWLQQSLKALDGELRRKGSRLVIRQGGSWEQLEQILRATGANTVCWNRRYEPAALERDRKVALELQRRGSVAQTFNACLLHEPGTILNQSSRPFQVFTPFWRACLKEPEPSNGLAAPEALRAPRNWPSSLPLQELGLEPKIDWAKGIRSRWSPGEKGATENLKKFLEGPFADYAEGRNRPAIVGTSRLSPHLHFGEISPRQVWHALRREAEAQGSSNATWRNSQFLAELGWREFAQHLLFHFPHTTTHPLRPEFEHFRWRENLEWLRAWQRGLTGYPMVDAGMRELWATGWMHNRVRMIVASFLVKDLLLTWHEGARWFWDTLVDADLANNTLGWQWTAGCGADAAPFFRIFNPVSQGEKFDPEGQYVRAWVPELGRLPNRWIHQPFAAPEGVLSQAGVRLGETYPNPIVPHHLARELALEAYGKMKKSKPGASPPAEE